MINQINKKIDTLIAKDEIGKSLDFIQDFIEFNIHLETTNDWKNEILLLNNNLNNLKSQFRRNIIDSRDWEVRKNKITNSLLELKSDIFRQLKRSQIKIPSYILDTIEIHLPEMIEVKGGSFKMGGIGGMVDEVPSHLVTLNSFSIGKFPVKNIEFTLFLNSTKIEEITKIIALDKEATLTSIESQIIKKNGKFICQSGKENNPVVYVSWFGAKEYCKWISFLTNETYRLPYEAEWEYAAKGGRESEKYKFSGGKNIEDVAWYEKNNLGEPNECGQKQPNELGIYDMSGNIWEWCEDWYDEKYYQYCHKQGIVKNPKGSVNGTFKNLRGGAWNDKEFDCRINSRGAHTPSKREDYYGFRIVKE